MADQPVAAPTPTIDPKTTANNIVKGIQDKSNGKPAATQAPITGQQPATPQTDPNEGKEKYRVDGKEIWLTPDQARAYVQKGISFEPKIDQLNRLQKETQGLLNDLKNNPAKILFDQRLGHTPETVFENIMASGQISDAIKEKVGQWYYDNVVAPMKLSPEQREAKEAKRQLEEYKSRDASARDQAIKQENQRRADLALQQLKANISEAMKDSGLPNNDSPLAAMMAKRAADIMRLGYFQRQMVTPKQAIEKVKAELKQIQTAWYDHLDEESLVKELGDKNAEKVKKYFLKLVKEAEKKQPVTKSEPTGRSGERKTISPDDMAEYLSELKRKG